MQVSSLPRKFNLPFAQNAGGGFSNYPIPDTPSGTPGQASLSTGFPTINFTPISAGGIPPFGADFNALLFQATSWNQWQAAGGPIFYDAAFQTAIGGYPNGAVIQSLAVPGNFWQSTVDNNTSNPDAGGANWITPPWAKGTGDVVFRPTTEALPNHVILNGTTIGNAASGATQLASSTATLIYQYLWNKFSNTQCPVSGGRGANALADFNAGKTLTVLTTQSTAMMGVDGMGGAANGLFSGVPVQSGSVTIPGSILGENLHTLLIGEITAHNHGINISDPTHVHNGIPNGGAQANAPPGGIAYTSTSGNTTASGTGISASSNNNGGSGAHNTVHRSMLVYFHMHI